METRDILNAVGQFAAPLVSTADEDDAVKIASAFLIVAEEILKAVGGHKLTAMMLYAAADKYAGEEADGKLG